MPPKEVAAQNLQTELLRDLLIVQLGLAGVPQPDIRKIAKCNYNRVNRIVRLLKPKSK